MTLLTAFFIGIITGIVVGYAWGSKSKKTGNSGAGESLVERQVREREVNLEKIKEMLLRQPADRQITNDDVQKLLGVSDATATRYLEELEKFGIITQIGSSGHAVSYRKNP